MALETIDLVKWKFAIGEDEKCLRQGREVEIPHTWSIEEGTEEYSGIGWYSCEFLAKEKWKDNRVQVLLRSVYHDACVYLNGREVGVHLNSGYTPFTIELTKELIFGEKNRLVVKVDNRFSEQMLPFEKSFDWANDGGIIRPVQLVITGGCLMKNITIMAHPVITLRDERQDQGRARFGIQAQIDGWKEGLWAEWMLYEGCDGEKKLLQQGRLTCEDGKAELMETELLSVAYWHFDSPNLYTIKLVLRSGDVLQDEQMIVFGFRDVHIEGRKLFLNGEQVRLPGMEWMPGSDPAYGMAETREQLEKMLRCLKESNSVLTRFHWQQDEWVYEWCDRHGMLVQEEVPFWGAKPPKPGACQWKVFTAQMEEMVCAHRNHPSIIAWGVGNELDAQCEETIRYIKDAIAYTHGLDPERTANYVSNSIFRNPELDGTVHSDIMMINDYIGTWHGARDQYGEWKGIVEKNPDKPMIPSEFGLCEPAFAGGDQRRNEIFLEKMECYRSYPNIVGTIYFCLNDYRTQMGEDGQGKYRKRVHGSTGLCGEPKPSYYTVQKEYAPLSIQWNGDNLTVACKEDIPSYTVKGYWLEIQDHVLELPALKPGETWTVLTEGASGNVPVKVYRPNGDRVL